MQYLLAVIVVAVNAAIYARLLQARRERHAMQAQ
jgi:hypothetical protein